jgi:WhiB family redox-sensing transcriptional regulator
MAEVSWLSEYKTAAAGSTPAAYGPDVLGRAGVFDAGLPGAEDDQGWQERALCAETDPEAFFPEKGGSTREAKKICTGCEVRSECLEYALTKDERFGIWGGLSERERRRLRRNAS